MKDIFTSWIPSTIFGRAMVSSSYTLRAKFYWGRLEKVTLWRFISARSQEWAPEGPTQASHLTSSWFCLKNSKYDTLEIISVFTVNIVWIKSCIMCWWFCTCRAGWQNVGSPKAKRGLTDLFVLFSVALDIYKQSSYNIYIHFHSKEANRVNKGKPPPLLLQGLGGCSVVAQIGKIIIPTRKQPDQNSVKAVARTRKRKHRGPPGFFVTERNCVFL